MLKLVDDMKLSNIVFYALEGCLACGIGFFLLKGYRKWQSENKRQSYPKDVVILHQFRRGLRAPSASPFCLKLETW
jgi:hypothetical protein